MAPSVSSRRAMVDRKRFSAFTLVAIGRNKRRLRLVGAVGATKALDGGVGLPARLEQIVDAQPLVPCREVGVIAAPGAASIGLNTRMRFGHP
jgi:hypothetical protein